MDFDDMASSLINRLRLYEEEGDHTSCDACDVRIESLSVHFRNESKNIYPEPQFDSPLTASSPQVTFSDEWIMCHFDETNSIIENIDAFTSRWNPSQTRSIDCAWIAVNRGASLNNKPLINEMKDAFDALARTHRQDGNITLTVASLDQLARQFNVTSGKWLVFTDEATADASWREIVKLVVLERGKGFAKVSVNKDRNHHAICVYVDDFSDYDEVMKLRNDLRRIGVVQKIGFKLDAYSHMGIYRRNPWGIAPTRYFD